MLAIKSSSIKLPLMLLMGTAFLSSCTIGQNSGGYISSNQNNIALQKNQSTQVALRIEANTACNAYTMSVHPLGGVPVAAWFINPVISPNGSSALLNLRSLGRSGKYQIFVEATCKNAVLKRIFDVTVQE